MELSYSGAQSPLYIVRNHELSVFDPDKVNVGTAPHNYRFTRQDTLLDREDMIYMFTDGLVDQLGGEAYKRYGTNQLKKLLVEIAGQNTQIQEQAMLDSYWEWKGDNKQTDDLTLLGIRV